MFRLESRNLLGEERGLSNEDGKQQERRKLIQRLRQLKQLFGASGAGGGIRDPQAVSKSRVVLVSWSHSRRALIVLFSNGILAWLFYQSDALKNLLYIYIDKYLLGKLASDHVVEAAIADTHIFLSYTEAKLTAIFMEKSSAVKGFKLKRKERLKIVEVDLVFNPTKRRIERHLIDDTQESLLMVWWQNGSNFVSPWTAPNTREINMSNVFVYDYLNNNFSLLHFGAIMNDILTVTFVHGNPKSLMTVEKAENGNTLKLCSYSANVPSEGDLVQLQNVLEINVSSPCLKVDFNSFTDRLFILCEDRSIMIFNIQTETVVCFDATINAVDLICSPSDSLFVVCDQYGQILLYDYCLNVIPANYDDLCLNDAACGLKDTRFINDRVFNLTYADNDDFVFIILPIHVDSLTLISEYVKHDYVSEAILNLKNLNWNTNSLMVYSAINIVFSHLIKLPLSPNRESQMETTLAVYFNPSHPVDAEILLDFKLEMHYLAKKFFYHLLRYSCFEKAFLLALDLNSVHLFNLLHKVAVQKGNQGLADASLLRVRTLQNGQRRAKEKETCVAQMVACQKKDSVMADDDVPARPASVTSTNEVWCQNVQSQSVHNFEASKIESPNSCYAFQPSVYDLYSLPGPAATRSHSLVARPPPKVPEFEYDDVTVYYRSTGSRQSVNSSVASNSENDESFVPPTLPPRKKSNARQAPPPLPPRRQLSAPASAARSRTESCTDSSVKSTSHIKLAQNSQDLCWLPKARFVNSNSLPQQLVSQLLDDDNSGVDFKTTKIECIHFGVV